MGNFRRFLGSRSSSSSTTNLASPTSTSTVKYSTRSFIWVDLLTDSAPGVYPTTLPPPVELPPTDEVPPPVELPSPVVVLPVELSTNLPPPLELPPPPPPLELPLTTRKAIPPPAVLPTMKTQGNSLAVKRPRQSIFGTFLSTQSIPEQPIERETQEQQEQQQQEQEQETAQELETQTQIEAEAEAEAERERKQAEIERRKQAEIDADLLIFTDTMDSLPLFGRQFGIAPTSIVREMDVKKTEEPKKSSKSAGFGDFFQQADEELESMYMDYLKVAGKEVPAPATTPLKSVFRAVTKSKSKAETEEKNCIICLESLAGDVSAPKTISAACQHTPTVCYGCIAKSIRNDLESKFWDEVKCPECTAVLIHDDVKRFADEETFTRYDRLSFRSAVSADKNFIWCLNCDFGQLHEKGATQPMVRCLSCHAVSCFKHAIKWHDGFTCDEYDTVLWDPDSYKEVKAKNQAAPTVENLSNSSLDRAKKLEKVRQRRMHEAQKKAAREKQAKEVAGLKAARKAAKKEPSTEAASEVQRDFAEKIAMLKRRKQEEELSASTVEKTTKRCPGCRWPIEKNAGCDHMTCIKCRNEFCWICLEDWHRHTRRCHP